MIKRTKSRLHFKLKLQLIRSILKGFLPNNAIHLNGSLFNDGNLTQPRNSYQFTYLITTYFFVYTLLESTFYGSCVRLNPRVRCKTACAPSAVFDYGYV